MISPRVLTCRDCEEDVEVFELPAPWIDEHRFRCIPCMDPRHATQLELVTSDEERKPEVRQYDPAQARIPY